MPARLYALIGGPEVMRSSNAEALLEAIATVAHGFKAGEPERAAAGLERAKSLGVGLGLDALFEHMANAIAAAQVRDVQSAG